MNQSRFTSALTIIVVLLIGTIACGLSSASSVVNRYVLALQRRDLLTVVKLTYSSQLDIASIRANNPKALWDELINDYYRRKIDALTAPPNQRANWYTAVFAALSDPAADIQSSLKLFPATAEWRVSETRAQQDTLKPFSTALVYVEVKYPNFDDAPESTNQFLKQMTIQFNVDQTDGLVLGSSSVPAGNIYWTKPYPVSAKPRTHDTTAKPAEVLNTPETGLQLPTHGYVNDLANILNFETKQKLEALCKEADEKAHAQIAVVTVTSLEGESIEQFASELTRQSGVGKAKDRGVLVLLAPSERQYRIEVGYELESILPGPKLNGFGHEAAPLLHRGDYNGGLMLMAGRVAGTIAASENVTLTTIPR